MEKDERNTDCGGNKFEMSNYPHEIDNMNVPAKEIKSTDQTELGGPKTRSGRLIHSREYVDSIIAFDFDAPN